MPLAKLTIAMFAAAPLRAIAAPPVLPSGCHLVNAAKPDGSHGSGEMAPAGACYTDNDPPGSRLLPDGI
eukprot:SAG11_NODE_28403_length_322_cov_0.690583_1_plen_68_part_10